MAGAPETTRLSGMVISPAFLMLGVARIVQERVDAELTEQGLSMRHLSVLGHLSAQPGLSYSELARRARVTAQSMQATLRSLEDTAAVVRRTLPGRGRTAQLHLTPSGVDLLDRGRRVLVDADRRLLADVPTEQHDIFTAALLHAFTAAATGDREAS